MNYIKEYENFIKSNLLKESYTTTLKYSLIGQGDEVIIALLGNNLLGVSAYYKTIDALKENYKVLMINHENIYQTVEELVSDLNHLIEELSLSKVHLLGISIGGVIAQVFAKKYPEKTDKLMLYQTFANTNIMEPDAKETKEEILEVIIQLEELRKQVSLEDIKMAQVYQIEDLLKQANYKELEDAVDLYTYLMIDYKEEDEKQLMKLLGNFLKETYLTQEDFSYLDNRVLFMYDFNERPMGGQSMDSALLDILPRSKNVSLDVENFTLILDPSKLVSVVLDFLS